LKQYLGGMHVRIEAFINIKRIKNHIVEVFPNKFIYRYYLISLS